jgi:hypothetical protein
MSNYLAIATVTEAFRQILDEAAAASQVPGAGATVARPSSGRHAGDPGSQQQAGVTLFLYQVLPNGLLGNLDAPTRRSDGSLRTPTRSAYDLHYLVTFNGVEPNLEPQRLIGSVLRILHSRPVLTRKRIEDAKMAVDALADSDLETEVETVKVGVLPLSLEELSKLWSVFFQTPYHLSMAFRASVVFLDGQEVPGPALPVRSRNVYVRTFRQPVVEQILSRKPPSAEALPGQAIEVGDTIVLVGKLLRGDTTRIRLGDQTIEPPEITDTRVEFLLTMPPFAADSLRAGVQGLQVVHWMRMGTPESDHVGATSNVEPFVLRPKVIPSATPVSSITVDSVPLCTDDVSLDFEPPVGVGQRVVLLLNELHPPPGQSGRAYQFDVPVEPPTPSDTYLTNIVVRVDKVVAGDYLVRVQVDGAESLLESGADPDNPLFESPKVTIA